MGRTSNVHPGAMDGASEVRLALKIPATKVPCMQAMLFALAHVPPSRPGISRMLVLARC